MSYYTSFDLSYNVPEIDLSPLNKFVAECESNGIAIPSEVSVDLHKDCYTELELERVLNDLSWCDYSPLMSFVNGAADSCKWYDWEMDMRRLSRQFPAVLFTLSGKGEEAGDLWAAYFLDGKMQKCDAKITFDDFDLEKLKD